MDALKKFVDTLMKHPVVKTAATRAQDLTGRALVEAKKYAGQAYEAAGPKLQHLRNLAQGYATKAKQSTIQGVDKLKKDPRKSMGDALKGVQKVAETAKKTAIDASKKAEQAVQKGKEGLAKKDDVKKKMVNAMEGGTRV